MDDLRVLVTADDPLARAGLAAVLAAQPNCQVVGQVATINLFDLLDVYRPDVVLWDLGWEHSSESLNRLRDEVESIHEAVPVIVLSPDTAASNEVWAAGARGILLRNIEPTRMVAALHASAHGLVTIDPAVAPGLIPEPAAPSSGSVVTEELTPREVEVLKLLAEGLPNKAIAFQLHISEHTVKFHINALMTKLGAQSRTDAVVRATRRGLLIL
jgi:two-component system, NarL family, nitrate/nitrite response regulator NarL